MNKKPLSTLLFAPLARLLAVQSSFPPEGRPTLRLNQRDGVFLDWRTAPGAGSPWVLQPGLSVTEALEALSRHAPCPDAAPGAGHHADAAALMRELQPWVVLELGLEARRIHITGPTSLRTDPLDLPSRRTRKGAA